MDFWVRVARDEAEDEEVREFFCARGITAAADFPAALYYRKLVKVGPRRIGRREKLIPVLTLLCLHGTSFIILAPPTEVKIAEELIMSLPLCSVTY